MKHILEQIGLCFVIFVIMYSIYRLSGYRVNRKCNTMPASDEKVFEAARAYTQGVSFDRIKQILLECIYFDEEDVDEVLQSIPMNTTDNDGGYSTFVTVVNQVAGERLSSRSRNN